jgi:hypothetical protein
MRFLRLDLIAFGAFTNAALQFTAEGPGLNVIYGPNEAGKSTALRAVRAALFGIPDRTGDNFLHKNEGCAQSGRPPLIELESSGPGPTMRRRPVETPLLDGRKRYRRIATRRGRPPVPLTGSARRCSITDMFHNT